MWRTQPANLGRNLFTRLRLWLAWGWLLGCLGFAVWRPSAALPESRDEAQPMSQSATPETAGCRGRTRRDAGIPPVPRAATLDPVCDPQRTSRRRPAIRTRRIEDIRVGQRVARSNPLRSQVEPGKEGPDPATWRQVEMRLLKPGDRRLQVVLLRPEAWLVRNGVRVGGTVELDLPEMGAKGRAEVLAVGACPPIEAGRGNVVTGTFTHEPEDNILDVRVEGLEEPIGVTDTHPFWSEDRQEFVAVGKLRVGERVRTKAVGVVRVTAIERRPREAWVYNLEVYPEHVYEVSNVGILVHNQNSIPPSTPVGRRYHQLGSVPPNSPTSIGGRQYSGHAIDRMQQRGIPPSAVENTIQYGQVAPGNTPGTTIHYDPVNHMSAVVDTATGRVVTVGYGDFR